MDFAISKIFSQLTFDQSFSGHVIYKNLNSSAKSKIDIWHPVVFLSRKIISAKTWYKTYDQEVQAIVDAFKSWRHYLKGCKYEVLVLTNHKIYRYKELELSPDWVSPEALLLPFSNRVLTKKSKYGIDALFWFLQRI